MVIRPSTRTLGSAAISRTKASAASGRTPAFCGSRPLLISMKTGMILPRSPRPLVDLRGQGGRIHGLDEVEDLDRFFDLVFLEVADEVPGRPAADGGEGGRGLLHVIFADDGGRPPRWPRGPRPGSGTWPPPRARRRAEAPGAARRRCLGSWDANIITQNRAGFKPKGRCDIIPPLGRRFRDDASRSLTLAKSIREELEDIERQVLSPKAVFSAESLGRVRPEAPHPFRTAFQRDRDRIIHTKSFRRLKHKTQVFLAPFGDHFRTRLTHTLEVSQIARTVAKALRLNEDLTEAIALGHDLGHTPFGHAGEDTLGSLLPDGFTPLRAEPEGGREIGVRGEGAEPDARGPGRHPPALQGPGRDPGDQAQGQAAGRSRARSSASPTSSPTSTMTSTTPCGPGSSRRTTSRRTSSRPSANGTPRASTGWSRTWSSPASSASSSGSA